MDDPLVCLLQSIRQQGNTLWERDMLAAKVAFDEYDLLLCARSTTEAAYKSTLSELIDEEQRRTAYTMGSTTNTGKPSRALVCKLLTDCMRSDAVQRARLLPAVTAMSMICAIMSC